MKKRKRRIIADTQLGPLEISSHRAGRPKTVAINRGANKGKPASLCAAQIYFHVGFLN